MEEPLFPEPEQPRDGWLGWGEPAVRWLAQCTRPEAATSRATVNAWYSVFPDDDGRLAQRLRSELNVDHLQALDELYVHHLLRSQHNDVRYEEGGVGPDFRVYESGLCIAAIEVATLFLRQDWSDEQRRHDRLAAELNTRLDPKFGYLIDFDIEEATVDPPPAKVARFLLHELEQLPPAAELAGTSVDELPHVVYERDGVKIRVRFWPARPDAASLTEPNANIIATGKMLAGMVNSGQRLKDAVAKKGGDRYGIDGIPFAVAVGNRDGFCSTDVVIEGLYGGEAVRFDRRTPDDYEIIRKNDGLFGVDRARGAGRHRRVSAVFVISRLPLWDEGTDIARYDNPYAADHFPSHVLLTSRRFGVLEPDAHTSIVDWLRSPPDAI